MELAEDLSRTLRICSGYTNPWSARYEVVTTKQSTHSEQVLDSFRLRDISDPRLIQCGLCQRK